MAATAVTTKGTIHGSGGQVEFGTFSLDAASIAAAAQGIETATIVGAKVGDIVFVQPRAMTNRAVCVGAKVTGVDTVSIYINNMYDATTAVDSAALVYDYVLIHLT